MTRRKGTRQRGKGFGSDLVKNLLMQGVPLLGKLLEGPASQFGNFLGQKVKRLTGSGSNLAGGGSKLAGGYICSDPFLDMKKQFTRQLPKVTVNKLKGSGFKLPGEQALQTHPKKKVLKPGALTV